MPTIPTHMRAVTIREPGGPEVLQLIETAVPAVGAEDVLIRVAAAGVNRPDVLQRQGRYPLPPDADPLPGLEVAGTIAATGEAARRFGIGERVMALTHGGGYAGYCAVHESHCLPVPESLSLREAAGVPETFFTVQYNLFTRGALGAGETLLVHGGSSGIGTTAIQLAKAFAARVITTAGSDEKCAFCEELGADKAINYGTGDWEALALEWTDGDGVDVVLDMVGGDYTQKNLNVLGRDGRYVFIGFLGGYRAELDLRPILMRRLTVTGSTLRPQSIAEKAQIAAELEERVLPLIDQGGVRPILYRTFPLEQAGAAHALMESSQHIGKIVLDVTDGGGGEA
jgi:putative PIG3 family NAD(P)H quinone oxidoreductase